METIPYQRLNQLFRELRVVTVTVTMRPKKTKVLSARAKCKSSISHPSAQAGFHFKNSS